MSRAIAGRLNQLEIENKGGNFGVSEPIQQIRKKTYPIKERRRNGKNLEYKCVLFQLAERFGV